MPNRFKMVAFEISNRCVYSHLHDLCPADPEADPVFLETQIIMDVLSNLGNGFSGSMYFSIYNEPLTDPRFFSLLDIARVYCPNAYINLFTNGWNLNQWMLDELVLKGVRYFHVSAYTTKEYARLSKLKVSKAGVTYNAWETTLDNRLGIYHRPENTNEGIRSLGLGDCHWSPTSYLFINHRADVCLCCWDCFYTITFGNLHTEKIEDIFESDRWKEICSSMKKGNRDLSFCKKCCNP